MATVIANNCINQCEFIQKVYDDIIEEQYGISCLSECDISLCDVLNFSDTATTDPEVITVSTSTVTNTTCNITLQEQSINHQLLLIEL